MTIGLVIVVKDEEDLIGEWLAYHSVIGVDQFIVYNNGSTDRTENIVLEAAREIDIRLIDWPDSSPQYQINCYHDAIVRFGKNLTWLGFIDCDEFLVPANGRSLTELLRPLDRSSGVAINWLVYGSSGHSVRPKGLVTENFVYRALCSFGPNHHIKSIIQPKYYKSANIHRMEVYGQYSDPNGEPVTWNGEGQTAGVVAPSILHINHYFTRSKACWTKKMNRGYRDIERSGDEFLLYDLNDVFDPTAAKFGMKARREFKFLDAEEPAPLAQLATALPDDFTRESYLALNPDVSVSDYLPEDHFIIHGVAEGRSYKF
jgi:hypothetical protein